MNKKEQDLMSKKTNIFTKGIEIPASSIDIESLPIHKKPKQVRDEIPTLNRFGYMKLCSFIFGCDYAFFWLSFYVVSGYVHIW